MPGPSARAVDAGGECSTEKGCGDTHAVVGAGKDNNHVEFRCNGKGNYILYN